MSLKGGLATVIFGLLMGTSLPALARPPSAGDLRAVASLSGDPHPSLVGVGVDYWPTGFSALRASFGYLAWGLGARFAVPSWDLTPVLGVGLTRSRLGSENQFDVPTNLGLAMYSESGSGLEAGMACGRALYKGDIGVCLPYLALSFPLR